MYDKIKAGGVFTVTHRDKNGKVLSEQQFPNLVTDEGINYMLNAALTGGSQITAFYLAPWSASYTPAAGDTYAAPGYVEANAEISEANRQAWAADTSTAKSVTNSVVAVITAASAVTIYGIGVVGGGTAAATKGDTAGGGTLFASASFGADSKTLATGETLSITYTCNGASA